MKATELRIGNFVYKESGKLVNDRTLIYKVENVNIQSASKFDPIPLNEEWILKFGLKKMIESEYTLDSYDFAGFKLWLKDGKFLFNDNIDIKTVNQLQNLYFTLTNEELTIKNTP